MKNKVILSVAATAALLFTSTGAINADAASLKPTVEKKVYVYQSGNINVDQINSFLQKYVKNYQIYLNGTNKQTTTTKPVQQPKQSTPTQSTKQPAPVQEKPATPAKEQQTNTNTNSSTTSQVSAFEQKVVELTNQERAKQGLPALKLDTELSKVAKTKSQDMKNKGYFSHTSPTYGSPFDMMKKFGITYRSAGENIAMGQPSPEAVVSAWMNSAGHRANILNSSYTHIGVGHIEGGNYWTQMFIGK